MSTLIFVILGICILIAVIVIVYPAKDYASYDPTKTGDNYDTTVAVVFYCKKDGHTYVLTHRRPNQQLCCPGGYVPWNMTWWDGAVKEAKEESGIDISDMDHKIIYSSPNKRHYAIELPWNYNAQKPLTLYELDMNFGNKTNYHSWIDIEELIGKRQGIVFEPFATAVTELKSAL